MHYTGMSRQQLIDELLVEQRRSREQIRGQAALLDAISRVSMEALSSSQIETVASTCLEAALEITRSSFGFIGELNEAGVLDSMAVSMGVPGTYLRMERAHTPSLGRQEIRELWMRVLKEGEPVIINDPSAHPEFGDLPEGHPLGIAIFGIPLRRQGSIIGLIGLAGKESGYTMIDQEHMEALSLAFAEALHQRRAEQALRESETKYRTLFENLRDAAFLIDMESGRILQTNRQGERLLGRGRAELTRMHHTELYPPDQAVSGGQIFDLGDVSSDVGELPPVNGEVLRKDGRRVPVQIRGVPLMISGQRTVLGIFRDITESRRTQRELAMNRLRLEEQVAVRTSELEEANLKLRHEVLVRKQVEQTIARRLSFERSLSDISSRFVGMADLDEAIDASLGDLGAISKADRVSLFLFGEDGSTMDRTNRWCADGVEDPTDDGLSSLPVKDFSWWLHQLGQGELIDLPNFSPIPPEAFREWEVLNLRCFPSALCYPVQVRGSLAGFTAFARVREPGAWQQDEGALLRMFCELVGNALERRRMEAELREARDLAEAASRAKDEFLANMTHELGTPLNAINGFSQVLLDRTYGELNEKQAEFACYILDGGKHLEGLINDILDFCKSDAGKMELSIKEVEPKALIEGSLMLIQQKSKRNGICIELDLDQSLNDLVMEVDERKFKQIMYNLLSNAAKFTPGGGKITIESRRVGWDLVTSVSDSGIGIAPEHHKKVFERFFQVRSGRNDKTPGTGLGLSLCQQIVELHGGRIWLESEGEGRGSRFSMVLPLRQPSQAQRDAAISGEGVLDLGGLQWHLGRLTRMAGRTITPFALCSIRPQQRISEKEFTSMTAMLYRGKRSGDILSTDDYRNLYLVFHDADSQRGRAASARVRGQVERSVKGLQVDCSLAVFPKDGESPELLLSKVAVPGSTEGEGQG